MKCPICTKYLSVAQQPDLISYKEQRGIRYLCAYQDNSHPPTTIFSMDNWWFSSEYYIYFEHNKKIFEIASGFLVNTKATTFNKIYSRNGYFCRGKNILTIPHYGLPVNEDFDGEE
jgi:hypothetical protein